MFNVDHAERSQANQPAIPSAAGQNLAEVCWLIWKLNIPNIDALKFNTSQAQIGLQYFAILRIYVFYLKQKGFGPWQRRLSALQMGLLTCRQGFCIQNHWRNFKIWISLTALVCQCQVALQSSLAVRKCQVFVVFFPSQMLGKEHLLVKLGPLGRDMPIDISWHSIWDIVIVSRKSSWHVVLALQMALWCQAAHMQSNGIRSS